MAKIGKKVGKGKIFAWNLGLALRLALKAIVDAARGSHYSPAIALGEISPHRVFVCARPIV